MEYKCKIPVGGTEKSIINKLIKQVKKEWFVKEVVKSSPGFSVTYEDEFEEGENICYFVKRENYLYYCGPINVRQKERKTYRLWVFDYIFYLNNKMYKIENLSYKWDTLSLKKIPENIIFNPCVIGNFEGVWQILKAKAVYHAEQFKDLAVIDMCPNSDNIDRTYTLTFYKNGYEIKRLEGIGDFEPSLLRQGIFYYKTNNIGAYTEYDFSSGKECESINDSESRIYKREETDFWKLLYFQNDGKYISFRKMEAEELKLFQKRILRQTFGYHEYYFAIKNPIAVIVIKDYFAKNAEIKLLEPMFPEDFSHNYRIRITNDNRRTIYQYRSVWLEGQSLDMYIPELSMGIEYQGLQHYEAVDVFGGVEGLQNAKRRDEIKREKCKENGVKLVEWNYKTGITDINFIEILNDLHIEVPQKKQAEFVFEKEDSKMEVEKWAIYQYALNGEFIAEFSNISEAAEKSGIREFNIQRACRGFRSTAGGYQWKRVELPCTHNGIEPIVEKKASGEARKIIQFSLDGTYIRLYESISAAVRQTGINSKSIRDAANGKQKQAGGYKWEYDMTDFGE